jgi:beta-carotene hydroxylase
VSIHKIDRAIIGPPAGSFTNPTMLLFFSILALFSASSTAALLGTLPPILAAFLNTCCLYAMYTVHHEAVHRLVHVNRHVNDWVGRIAGALEGIPFPMLRILHFQHHAFTNAPELDPDYTIGRRPRWLLPLWVVISLAEDNFFMINHKLWSRRRAQLFEHCLTVALQVGVILVAVLAGYTRAVTTLWVIPIVASGILLKLSVALAVHYPHDSQHPLEHTRMYSGRLLFVITLGQSRHLVHHLWPRIPWYRYGHAVEAAREAVAKHHDETGRSTSRAV